MYIHINSESKTPAYKQIYSSIRSKIICGAFPYNSRLPSKRELAHDCGVSVVTVEHALHLLCDEGFCEMRSRSGCYVRYSYENNFPVSDYISEENIHERPEDFHYENIPFSSVSSQFRKVILDYGEKILMKSPNNGCAELRESICRYLSRNRNINVSPEQIVIGSGAEYLYGICIQMLGRERIVALENPSYEKIREVYQINGAECDMLDMDDEGIRTDELKRTRASVLHVTPFNSYPSHITASSERRHEYVRWAQDRNAVIIEDDYDSEFIVTGTAPETLFSQNTDGNVIYINTFSRTIAPSLRAGYMILPKKMIPVYEETVGFYSCTVPMLEQYFLTEWIDSGEFERNISRIRRKNQKN